MKNVICIPLKFTMLVLGIRQENCLGILFSQDQKLVLGGCTNFNVNFRDMIGKTVKKFGHRSFLKFARRNYEQKSGVFFFDTPILYTIHDGYF